MQPEDIAITDDVTTANTTFAIIQKQHQLVEKLITRSFVLIFPSWFDISHLRSIITAYDLGRSFVNTRPTKTILITALHRLVSISDKSIEPYRSLIWPITTKAVILRQISEIHVYKTAKDYPYDISVSDLGDASLR